MAAVYDWNAAFTLTTPQGTLPLNQLVTVGSTDLGYFVLDHEACDSGTAMRVVRDDEPQMSGEIMHNHYRTGYEMRLKLELWETIGSEAQPACRGVLEQMGDLLQKHLNSIVGDDPFISADGRIQWTPDGGGVDRMLDRIRLIERPEFVDDGPVTTVTFSVLTQYPYAMDAPETTTALADVTPTTITNDGTASFWPVVKVYGPSTFFELKNSSYLDLNGNPSQIIFDSDLPGAIALGAGQYIEFGFFRNTAYLNGNSTNMKPGINLQDSDFWPLIPGDNTVEIDGATADVLWQNAYA